MSRSFLTDDGYLDYCYNDTIEEKDQKTNVHSPCCHDVCVSESMFDADVALHADECKAHDGPS